MKKKKILVTAGGTAIAWHICQIVNQYFFDKVEVYVCDINDEYLVPAISCARKVYKVPFSSDSNYIESIKDIIVKENIDILIPLLPEESILFSSDSDFIKELGIISAAPRFETANVLSDKKQMWKFLKSISVPTPEVYGVDEILSDKKYIIKPKLGFGSLGVKVCQGNEVLTCKNIIFDDMIIQEYCDSDDYDEVTVEIFNSKNVLKIFARRRVSTKSGVCVKMELIDNNVFYPFIKVIVDSIECPIAFNVQFLRDNSEWKLFDCNLRLGAGTALSTAAGFQLTRAFISTLIGEIPEESLFNFDKSIKSVLRVYQEIVVK